MRNASCCDEIYVSAQYPLLGRLLRRIFFTTLLKMDTCITRNGQGARVDGVTNKYSPTIKEAKDL